MHLGPRSVDTRVADAARYGAKTVVDIKALLDSKRGKELQEAMKADAVQKFLDEQVKIEAIMAYLAATAQQTEQQEEKQQAVETKVELYVHRNRKDDEIEDNYFQAIRERVDALLKQLVQLCARLDREEKELLEDVEVFAPGAIEQPDVREEMRELLRSAPKDVLQAAGLPLKLLTELGIDLPRVEDVQEEVVSANDTSTLAVTPRPNPMEALQDYVAQQLRQKELQRQAEAEYQRVLSSRQRSVQNTQDILHSLASLALAKLDCLSINDGARVERLDKRLQNMAERLPFWKKNSTNFDQRVEQAYQKKQAIFEMTHALSSSERDSVYDGEFQNFLKAYKSAETTKNMASGMGAFGAFGGHIKVQTFAEALQSEKVLTPTPLSMELGLIRKR